MDGSPDAGLRYVRLRIEHDCPLARLSRECRSVDFQAWSGHRHEVVEARCGADRWPRVEAAARRHLRPERVLPAPEGGLVVWEPRVEPSRSISRILEAHHLLWLQPMHARDGWEHYDAIAFGPGGEQAALDALSKQWPTQVVRRREAGPGDLLASFFLSLRPVLESPTDRQAEALVQAWRDGYYGNPRKVRTRDVAERMGLGRSAFEERLRGGENRVMAELGPVLEHYRFR